MRQFRQLGFALWIAACGAAVLSMANVRADEASLAFRLTTPDGEAVELAARSTPQLTVICFLGAECPLARLYGPRLSNLARSFSGRGVRFIGVNSNAQDSLDEVRKYVREHHLSLPVVKDLANAVADRFGARRTPEVFVVDQSLAVRYHGRIDDQFQPGLSRSQPTRDDLRIALEELLSDQPVSVAKTAVTGCHIGRVKQPVANSDITFCKQVARVLQTHCVECHRSGEIGPFSLTDYNEVIGWGETMRESVDAGRMPPWHANPAHGTFANARHMPEADKQLLRDWVASGMPYGDAAQLPEPKTFPSEWQLPRPPDLVVAMRERPFVVPAAGTVDYQYFVVDPKFDEDRWVTAAQVIPAERSVVHHAIVFVRPPDGEEFRGIGWLTAYVPGQRSFGLPPGHARRVPAGSKLVFQMHYTPNGMERKDITRVGINFVSAEEVTHEVFSLLALEQEFEIPPFTAGHAVDARLPWIPKRGQLLAIAPHMHLRGQSIRVVSRRGESQEVLLDVPHYDFNWQHVYELVTPLSLADVDEISFTARFDNSANNPVNPDPSQRVTWGDQTWEEMAAAFFEVAVPRAPAADDAQPAKSKPADTTATDAAVEALVKRLHGEFDRNRDGVIERTETSRVFRTYGFPQIDSNGDGRITRDEIASAARRRQRR
jgi:peroxiredoxin